MSPNEPPREDQSTDWENAGRFERRRFLALGAGVGATLLAGCSAESEPGDGSDGDGGNDGDDDSSSSGDSDDTTPSGDSDGTTSDAGTFRLLISDQPVAIDDFDELNVSFDRARIFRGEGDEDDEGEETDTETETEVEDGTETETETEAETETETGTETEAETETETETEVETGTGTVTEAGTETEAEDDEPDDGDGQGFSVVDLDGATVDLTQVVGEKAIGVFDGELEEGRYTKIELYAASVEGIVDGEAVDVKIPSGKLQIVKPFEVVAGETLTFVFDINVVKKGRSGEYNLLPVISESGVAGKDVEVEEVGSATGSGSGKPDPEGADGSETDAEGSEEGETEGEESEGEDGRGDGGDGGPPDEAGRGS